MTKKKQELIISPNYARPYYEDLPPIDYEVDEIMFRIAQGETLRAICKSADLPSYAHVLRWVTSGQYPGITKRFTAALACAGHVAAERIQEVLARLVVGAEDKKKAQAEIADIMKQLELGLLSAEEAAELSKVATARASENLLDANRAKVMIDALKWTAERQCPQFYTPQRNIGITPLGDSPTSGAKTVFVNFIDSDPNE